jgi:hypothetical protein
MRFAPGAAGVGGAAQVEAVQLLGVALVELAERAARGEQEGGVGASHLPPPWREPPRRYDGTSALMPVVARPMMSFWICEVPS